MRALRLEKTLDTPAHIYYKYEGVSPVGRHKPNTAVPQAFYNKDAGTKALTTETGAGQWGTALAMACKFFDIDLEVYMVKVSYHQKPYRRILMENFGRQVYASPTDRTHAGRAALAAGPQQPRLAGHRHLEAVEVAATSGGAKKYSARLGAQPRAAAPDRHRPGSAQADGDGRRVPGHGHRLRGRRLQLRRDRLPVPAREPEGRARRTRLIAVEPASLPQPDQGHLHLRLRRHGRDGADRQDAHPRPQLHPAGHPRRRPALPRHGAAVSARWSTPATSRRAR